MNIKKIFSLVTLFLCVLFLTSCSSSKNQHSTLQADASSSQTQDQKIHVLCTTGMIRDLVQQIGKDHITTEVLIKENLDPHTYELVKGDGEKLSEASIIFYNGLGLEHSPHLFMHLKKHPNSHALGDYIASKFPNELIYVDQQVDPHIWMNVALWKESIDLIVQVLLKEDPNNSEVYLSNAHILSNEMSQTHHTIMSMLQELPENQRYLVTCHDAFNYFTKVYLSTTEEAKSEVWRERCKSPEGLSPDSQLSLADIQEVVQHLKKHDIQMVFPEANVNLNSIKKIMEATKKMGLSVHVSPYYLYADSLSKKGEPQDTYLKMIHYNAEIISKCLKMKSAYEKR